MKNTAMLSENEDEDVLRLAYLNSFYQTGLKNILDRTVLKYEKLAVKQYKKIDEVPFDFERKIMSVVVEMDGKHRIISKGAPEEIFKRCTHYELDGEITELGEMIRTDLKIESDHLSSDGFRVLAIAYKDFENKKEIYSKNDEQELILKGYIAFLDPPKPTAKKTIEVLKTFGIEVKVLTGDNELVTQKICSEVGLDVKGLVTGETIEKLSDKELQELVKDNNCFCKIIASAKSKNNQCIAR